MKVILSLQNIPCIFYSIVFFLQITYLTTFHQRIRIGAAQQFLRSTTRLHLSIQHWNFIAIRITVQKKKLKNAITCNFLQSFCNPTFCYVLSYNFIQLYINVRRYLVHTISLHCVIFLLIDGSTFSLMMSIYSRNM
jgi:hypothetical protein